MQQHLVPLEKPRPSTGSVYLATIDPVGEVNDSLPVHPDPERPSTQDLWEEVIKKQPRRKPPRSKPNIKRPGTDSQIDDYA